MIKGSLDERLEYEEYIRSLKDTVRYPFWNIYRRSEVIARYYFIEIAKEKRGFDLKEKRILHLMALADYVVRVGGIVCAWWWEEFMPKIISQMSNRKAEWAVDAQNIARTFISVPTKTVEAALLKTNANTDVILRALNAQRAGNLDALAEQLCSIPADDIFEPFKLIDAYRQICELISDFKLSDDKSERKMRYLVKDTLETITPTDTVNPVMAGNKLLSTARSFEIDEDDVLSYPEKYLRAISVVLCTVGEYFNDELGESDPVAQTISEILEEERFQRIFNYYVQFPRDEEWCLSLSKKIMLWGKEYLGIDIPMNGSGLKSEGDAEDACKVDTHFLGQIRFDSFVGECLHIERGAENGFAYRYKMNLIELIRETTTGTGLYAIAMLLFPIKPKPGRKTVGTDYGNLPRLKKEISWKTNLPAPRNHQEVVALLIQYFPRLKEYDTIDIKSAQPARLIDQLVKEVDRGRSWIKDFIGDYWSPEMANVFDEKLSPHKGKKDSRQS